MVYKFRPGYSFPGVKAVTVAVTITDVMTACGGQITPGDLVDASRPDDAPLHTCFTWDDAEAAEKCREDEARRIIRSYVIVREDERGREVEEIANISVAAPFDEDGPSYKPARDAMEDPDLRARVIALARAQLHGWEARYGHLAELAEAVELVRRAREAAEQPAAQPAARPGRRQRRGRRPAPAAAVV